MDERTYQANGFGVHRNTSAARATSWGYRIADDKNRGSLTVDKFRKRFLSLGERTVLLSIEGVYICLAHDVFDYRKGS